MDRTINTLFQTLTEIVSKVEYREENPLDENELFFIIEELGNYINQLSQLQQQSPNDTDLVTLVENLQNIRLQVNVEYETQTESPGVFSFHKSLLTGKGRPKIDVSEESLLHFRELGFNWKQISSLLLVSRTTLWRRVKELGLTGITGYSDISDEELDQKIKEIKNLHGLMTGRSMIAGYLKSHGIRVTQNQIRKSLVRIDPESSNMRWSNFIQRRQYNVAAPNCLWHMDGYHALVNWGFVIHGAIDGFSRYITYLCCSTNNCKETVSILFEEAIVKCGVPSRIRTDKGGENVLLWDRMVELRGENRGSFIAGTSVHNQRIERLWRDVWNSLACQFYYTFQAMEAEEILDKSNKFHLYVLHYIFLPRINFAISSFVNGWNNHPLRTEKNWTPNQLWTSGMLDVRNNWLDHVRNFQDLTEENLLWYGVDMNGPIPLDCDDLSVVELYDVESPLNGLEENLLRSINPLSISNSFGIDIFIEALELLNL